MKDGYRDCKKWSSAGRIQAKQKIKEETSSDECSYFFKVLLGDFSQKLSVPPAFVSKLIHETDANTVLHVPSGHEWVVRLCGTSTGLEFGQGWDNFVHDQRLELGDFLVFKYICRSKFKVWIFGRSGCEKNTSVCESEEIHYDLQKKCNSIESAAGRNFAQPWNSQLLIDLVSEEEDNNKVAEKQRKIPKHSSSSHCCSPKSPVYRNSSFGGEKPKLEKTFTEVETGERSYRGTYYISRRRPVTEAERNKALQDANSFKSDNPFSSMLLKPSHVYHGFWVAMPQQCIRILKLPRKQIDITFVDPKNKEWKVRYSWNGFRANLCGGWRHFSKANNLEEGDVCILERVDRSTNKIKLRVYVFRIIKKITPYKRMYGKIMVSSTLPSSHSKKYLAIDMSAKTLEPAGKYAEQVKKTDDSNSIPRSHSKRMTFLKEDLGTDLSGKPSGPEQEKNANQGVITVKKESTSNVNNCSKFIKSKCTQAIPERKTGWRRSRRLAQTCDKLMCPMKELLHCEPSVNGHKSIAKDTRVLPKVPTSVADLNGEDDDLMIIWDSKQLSRYSAL